MTFVGASRGSPSSDRRRRLSNPHRKWKVPMTRYLSRFDAVLSILAVFSLLSPLVLASVMFVVTSHV